MYTCTFTLSSSHLVAGRRDDGEPREPRGHALPLHIHAHQWAVMAPKRCPIFHVDDLLCSVSGKVVNVGVQGTLPRAQRFPVCLLPSDDTEHAWAARVRAHPKFAALPPERLDTASTNSTAAVSICAPSSSLAASVLPTTDAATTNKCTASTVFHGTATELNLADSPNPAALTPASSVRASMEAATAVASSSPVASVLPTTDAVTTNKCTANTVDITSPWKPEDDRDPVSCSPGTRARRQAFRNDAPFSSLAQVETELRLTKVYTGDYHYNCLAFATYGASGFFDPRGGDEASQLLSDAARTALHKQLMAALPADESCLDLDHDSWCVGFPSPRVLSCIELY